MNGDVDGWWPEVLGMLRDRVWLIHARVGYEEGPQVPDPAAPEYAGEVKCHMGWWEAIMKVQRVGTLSDLAAARKRRKKACISISGRLHSLSRKQARLIADPGWVIIGGAVPTPAGDDCPEEDLQCRARARAVAVPAEHAKHWHDAHP